MKSANQMRETHPAKPSSAQKNVVEPHLVIVPLSARPVLHRIFPVQLPVPRQISQKNQAPVNAQHHQPHEAPSPLAATDGLTARPPVGVLVLHGLKTPQQRRVELRGFSKESAERLADAMQVLPGLEGLGSLEGRRQMRILA